MVSGSAGGIVLGPYEAFCAELMWFGEVCAAVPARARESDPRTPLRAPRVAWQLQRRILQASLLYGRLDTRAAGPNVIGFIDATMFRNGRSIDPEVWRSELFERWWDAPFQRFDYPDAKYDYEDGRRTMQFDLLAPPIPIDAPVVPEPVIVAVERFLRRVGYERIDGTDVKTYSRRLRDLPWPPDGGLQPFNAALAARGARAVMAAVGVHRAIERSVNHDVAFFSRDALAPEWIQMNEESPQFEVVEAVFSLPEGPELPRSIGDLRQLDQDPRVVHLREFVDWATNRILTAETTALLEVKKEVQQVARAARNRQRGRRVAEVVTYLGVPVGAAEALAGTAGVGLSLASLGVLGQGVSSMIARSESKHWISI